MSCNDGVVNTYNTSVTEVSASHIDDGVGMVDVDFCSPFCQCNCCHISATAFSIVSYTVSSPMIPFEVNLHSKYIEDKFQNSILQPPRV